MANDPYQAARAAVLIARGSLLTPAEEASHLGGVATPSENPGERYDFPDGSRLYRLNGSEIAVPPGTAEIVIRPS